MGVTLLFVTFVGRVAEDEFNVLISATQKQHGFESNDHPKTQCVWGEPSREDPQEGRNTLICYVYGAGGHR
jgi:hypothetical protein